MATRGQRFELDLDADEFTAKPLRDQDAFSDPVSIIGELREHDTTAPPPAPTLTSNKSGFPEHKARSKVSSFRQQKEQGVVNPAAAHPATRFEPSDKAITHQVGKKYGVDFETQQKAEISADNKRRIAEMSAEDIEEARAELRRNLNPAFLERLLKRANIEEDSSGQHQWPDDNNDLVENQNLQEKDYQTSATASLDEAKPPAVHFPAPPRSKDDFKQLDSNDASFLSDLKTHYFPELPHDPSSLTWLQDLTDEEERASEYNPARDSFAPSALRFGFKGRLIPPKESLTIDVKQGLHHHGDAPSSAGYTIPELSLLARSSLPNQRCMSYQILGRIFFRLGRGDFGARGSDLYEALWTIIEQERPLDVIMSEANRQSGHASAKAHATEALWLWRKGGDGERGISKTGRSLAK